MGFNFFITNILLGAGLAMDAFSVSVANGLNEPNMKNKTACLIAGTFAFYQFLMPEIGWFCVHNLAEKFNAFQKFIPWIALLLLGYIGGKMLNEGIRDVKAGDMSSDASFERLSIRLLVVQGIATSIDALSVGFTIADYNASDAFIASLLIAIVTFGICIIGVKLGRFAGKKLSGKASILGGCILLFIGIEVFLTNI